MTKLLLEISHKNMFLLLVSSIFVAITLMHFELAITPSKLCEELRREFGVSFQSRKCHFA